MHGRPRWIALLALLAVLAPTVALCAALPAPHTPPAAPTPSLFLPLTRVAPLATPALRSVHLVKDIATQPQPHSSNPSDLTVADGSLYFVAEAGNHGRELWRYDGNRATQLTSFASHGSPTTITDVTVLGNRLVFVVNEHNLWSMDRTSLATMQLGTFQYAAETNTVTHAFTVVKANLFFVGSNVTDGNQLWKTDGIRAGTVPLTKLPHTPAADVAPPIHLTAGNGVLFFTADDNVHGHELWKSDGTVAGTLLVADLAAGAPSAYPEALTMFNGALYFVADVDGRALWRSDGTTAGTVRIAALAGASTMGTTILAAGTSTLFLANPILTQTLVLAYDGTTVREVTNLSHEQTIQRVIAVGNTVFLAGSGEGSGLYSVTTTTTTTVGLSSFHYAPRDLVPFGDRLFFIDAAYTSAEQNSIWITDGTSTGTLRVSDHVSDQLGLKQFVVFGSALFFPGSAQTTGAELWKTDGTPAGTLPVLNPEPGCGIEQSRCGCAIQPWGVLSCAYRRRERYDDVQRWNRSRYPTTCAAPACRNVGRSLTARRRAAVHCGRRRAWR